MNNDSSTPIMDALYHTGKVLTYDYYIDELKYIQNSLKYIDKNIKKELSDIEDSFTSSIFDKKSKNKIIEQHKSIQLTIIEGLFIRQIALVEKFFINLSLAIYSEESKKFKYRPALYPPYYDEFHFKENKNKHFTNSHLAVKYLKKTFDININEQKEWEIYISMINIRNLLAHGQKLLNFKSKDEVNTCNKYKSIGKILIPLNEGSKSAYLNIETTPYINLINVFIELIQYTEKYTYKEYLHHYFPGKEKR